MNLVHRLASTSLRRPITTSARSLPSFSSLGTSSVLHHGRSRFFKEPIHLIVVDSPSYSAKRNKASPALSSWSTSSLSSFSTSVHVAAVNQNVKNNSNDQNISNDDLSTTASSGLNSGNGSTKERRSSNNSSTKIPLTPQEIIVQLERVLDSNELGENKKNDKVYYDSFKAYKKYLSTSLLQSNNKPRIFGSAFVASTAGSSTNNKSRDEDNKFLSSSVAEMAIECLIKSNLPTIHLIRQEVRDIERLFGNLLQHQQQEQLSTSESLLIDMTDKLSYLLLKANSRGGNVGRTLAILELRQKRQYPPQYKRNMMTITGRDDNGEVSSSYSKEEKTSINDNEKTTATTSDDYYYVDDEYIHAINSIHVAGQAYKSSGVGRGKKKSRNRQQQQYQQNEQELDLLDDPTRWLDYILRHMKERDVPLTTFLANRMIGTFASTGRSSRAMHHFYKLVQQELEKNEGEKEENDEKKSGGLLNKITMQRNKDPPDYKVPSLSLGGTTDYQDFVPPSEETASTNKNQVNNNNSNNYMQLSKELELKWSPGVTAAFAFAKSLSQGVYGHAPVQLNLASWNILIKVCCYRGALHRALYLLQYVMPKQENLQPDIYTYNVTLHALARVGDITTQMNLLTDMTNTGVIPNEYTVQALVRGHISKGDISTAVTIIQDIFNQYHVLPFIDTNFDVMEAAIANNLPYEAKRHFFFLQQLWKWEPSSSVENEEDIYQNEIILDRLHIYRTSPRMNRQAMERFFNYHQIDLNENDFIL